ncbi:MAG: hypothetical protein Q9195_006349 [Heterodermia aff. obscurata]
MTSLERTIGGFYGDSYEPTYNALSYTWGRFATDHGPALKVDGITWNVPRIKHSHFTVESFHDTLKRAAGRNGLVWVDIACIDQKNIDVKMDEIGKQADIFSQADQVYIWLTSQSIAEASATLRAMNDFESKLEQVETGEFSFDFRDSDSLQPLIWESAALIRHLRSLFSDPWFSSLWTLQEACLCEKAHFLSKDARVLITENVHSQKGKAVALNGPVISCQQIKMALFAYAETNQPIKDLITLIDKSGLSYFHQGFDDNRNSMLLYSAAHHRTCSEPLDRIYGIMQVYGFKLGASRKPGGHYTLAELEDQFGEALNHVAPVTAQTHVHTIPQRVGSAWRPSNSSVMPEIYYMSRQFDPMCSITCIKGRPFFKGKACPLATLHDFWVQANALSDSLYHVLDHEVWQHYLISIHLDATERGTQNSLGVLPQFQNSREPPRSCPCTTCANRPKERKDGLARFLATLPGAIEDYSVLLLGSRMITQWTRPGIRYERIEGTSDPWKGVDGSFTVATRSGILVVKPRPDEVAWRRVGIVSWEAGLFHLKPVHEALWQEFDNEIG